MTKISVIVPVYNKEQYIRQCLDSLLKQTLKDIDIIVIDDNSTDNSLKIMQEYTKYSNFTILHNETNLGIGKTRNRGLEYATGIYVGFVDGDDYVKDTMYLDYYNYAIKNNLDIVTGYYTKVGNNLELFKNTYFDISNIKTPNIINNVDYGPCNKIFKLDIIKEHNITFEEKLKYEDMPFVASNLLYSKIGHINESYYYYRIHSNSETTIIDKRVFDIYEIMDKVNTIYEDITLVDLEYLNIHQITMYMLQQKNQKDEALKNKFINDGYKYLNDKFPNWKHNKQYKKESIIKRTIKNNKLLLKLYCSI